jgi:hypothetical protein
VLTLSAIVKLQNPLSWATLVYCNNVSAVYLSTNPIEDQRKKHVEIDLHIVLGDICVLHVPTTS